jgi:NADH-quinone oxidoreductase subunit G/NADP-reducing hydrogenase subunit HndD
MIKQAGIDFRSLDEEVFDDPLGQSTGAADIFGVTGGVMEAAIRTVYVIITGRELPFEGLHVTPIVGLDQVKDATLKFENVLPEYKMFEGFEAKIAVTSGLAGAKILMDQIMEGKSPYHFIEVMGCPSVAFAAADNPEATTRMCG